MNYNQYPRDNVLVGLEYGCPTSTHSQATIFLKDPPEGQI